MSEFQIRIATDADVEELHALIYEAFTPLRDLGIRWHSVNASIERVRENVRNTTTFVLEIKGKIISTISVRYPWEERSSVATYPFVWWFATRPEYDGKGFGSQLLRYVEEAFIRDTLKCAAVTLGTSARKHPWLLEIYERRGYRIFRERETRDGDLGVMMVKELIPEQFDDQKLTKPKF